MHPAEKYNRAKNIIFSILNGQNELAAYKRLDTYRIELGLPLWYGLKAELDFYTQFKKEFILDPTLDYGLKCDFTGNIDGINNCRIDVTTNLDFKKLEQYEAIQKKDERMYKIVVMDKVTGEIADIVDLNFPFNNETQGRLFDIVMFMPSDSKDGELKHNPYQEIITIDSNDFTEYKEVSTETDYYIPDFDYYASQLPIELNGMEFKRELTQHAINTATLLGRKLGRNIVACGQRTYQTYSPDGEGEWVTRLYWKHPVIENYLEDVIDLDF